MGCVAVYELLHGCDMQQYYQIAPHPGTPPVARETIRPYAYLDDPAIRAKLLVFDNGRLAGVMLEIPAIHCASCVWLLENLCRLEPGVTRVDVQFAQKRVHIEYATAAITLSQIVERLAALGYAPRLSLAGKEAAATSPDRRLIMRIGVAAFCFLNVMLFSFPEYLAGQEVPAHFRRFFSIINLLLSLPVLVYAGSDWFRLAAVALRRGLLTMDVPIAVGLLVLFARSAFDVVSHSGPGYWDSLCGFVFFLLLGQWCQQKSFARLSFERDYKAYFPLSVLRETADGEKMVPIDALRAGDIIVVRNQELIPADSQVLNEQVAVDYSFVTGESDLQTKHAGEMALAGGKVVGHSARLRVDKEVVHSFLVSLWSMQHKTDFRSLADVITPLFIAVVLLLATGGAAYWGIAHGDWGKAAYVLCSVLIVACPCALAISAPFVLGTMLRMWEPDAIFVKAGSVLEKLARVNTVVFDKTGTLTRLGQTIEMVEGGLSDRDKAMAMAVARQSMHPASVALCRYLDSQERLAVQTFAEFPGYGVSGTVAGVPVWIGRPDWVTAQSGAGCVQANNAGNSRQIAVAIDSQVKAVFAMHNQFREGWRQVVAKLAQGHQLHLLSGDSEREKDVVAAAFPQQENLHFYQDPWQKTEYIQKLQAAGRRVAMVGDGLNDAGAFRQSDVAIAVSEENGHFTPASDIIMRSSGFALLPDVFALAQSAMRIVHLNFLISFFYNLLGVTLALRGTLAPWLVAVLMPLSSISVILVAQAGVFYLVRQRRANRWK